jgi:hypothetical protein
MAGKEVLSCRMGAGQKFGQEEIRFIGVLSVRIQNPRLNGCGNGSKRMLPGNRADRGRVASRGQHHLAGNGADFPLVLKLETP